MNKKSEIKSSNLNFIENQEISYEISLGDIFSSILRRKKFFLLTFFSFIAIGCKLAFDKPVWKGEFQIVIQQSQEQPNSSVLNQLQNSPLSSLFGGSDFANDLQTEVKILESSSVLNPIYNFVKKEKEIKDENTKIKYQKWKKSLKIKLIEGTSVLNIYYLDKNKELIIPVLNKLSKAYQTYSKRDRLRSIDQGITYLEDQKEKMKIKSKQTLDEFVNYASENNLDDITNLPIYNPLDFSNDNNLIESNFFASDISSKYAKQFAMISNLESLILEKSSVLKDDSQIMISLRNKLKNLKDSIKKPSQVLIKYRDKKRDAVRDELMLVSIENQLSYLKLEKAKQKNPWELISKPTLIDDPVSPRKLRIIALSIILGSFFGSLFSILKDKNSKYIFNISDAQNLIPFTCFDAINLNRIEKFKEFIYTIVDSPITNNKGIVLFPVFDNFPDELTKEINSLNKNRKTKDIIVSSNLLEHKDDNIILIVKGGSSTFESTKDIVKRFDLLSINVIGWLFIES